MENFLLTQKDEFGINNENIDDNNTILDELKEEDRKIENEKNNYSDFEDKLYEIKFDIILENPYQNPGEIKAECFSLRYERHDNLIAAGKKIDYLILKK